MKPALTLARLCPQFQRFFPPSSRKRLWNEIEPRHYPRRVDPVVLLQVFASAFLLRLGSLRVVLKHFASTLHTPHPSTLSYALSRPTHTALAVRCVEDLSADFRLCPDALVILDSMPLILPATRRHGCAPVTDTAVGGGVLFAFCPKTRREASPLRVLRVITGGWHDSQQIRSVALQPRSPVYIMDRGFYAISLLQQWLAQEVRFIVRANTQDMVYHLQHPCGRPRRHGDLAILIDAVVSLGSPKRWHARRPRVRLVEARLANGERLVLVSSQLTWSAERLLDAYKLRWHIERLHKLLKDVLGLAHLYSFKQQGIEWLLQVALLVVLMLLLGKPVSRRADWTVEVLRRDVDSLRDALGIESPWKRNTLSKRYRHKNH